MLLIFKLWLIFLCPFLWRWTPHNNGCCFIISLITLHGYIIILFVSFQGFIPKTATYRKLILWLQHVWQCFSCMQLHQAQLASTAEFSFFLSKNVTYFFFESMITLLYQPLCCGSPMGTMNFSMCNGIWLTEFSQSFFLPMNSFPLSHIKGLWNPNMKMHFAAPVQPPHMFWTLIGWAKGIILLMVVMVVDVKSTQLWLGEQTQGKFLKSVKAIHLK